MGRRILRFLTALAALAFCGALLGGGIGLAIGAPVTSYLGATPGGDSDGATPAASDSSDTPTPERTHSRPETGAPTPSRSPSSSPAGPLTIKDVRAYDPRGDGHEKDEQAQLAIDGNPVTEWTTEHYSTKDLGGLKSGVGLLLDLGRKRPVDAVHLRLRPGGGSTIELRAGDTPESLADLPVVKTIRDAATTHTYNLPRTTKARYWLVWFTDLPPEDGNYRAGVAEVELIG